MKKCKQCGKCCCEFEGTLVTCDTDILRWKKEGRYDILKHVDLFGKTGDLWFKDGLEGTGRCMWLRKVKSQNKYYCRIHNTKPTICREYPKGGNCLFDKDVKIPKSTKWL